MEGFSSRAGSHKVRVLTCRQVCLQNPLSCLQNMLNGFVHPKTVQPDMLNPPNHEPLAPGAWQRFPEHLTDKGLV